MSTEVIDDMALEIIDEPAAAGPYALPTVGTAPDFRLHGGFLLSGALWEDLIGANDVAQATGGNQGTPGADHIAFDVTDDFMGTPNLGSQTSWTYFFVFERESTSSNVVYYPVSWTSTISDAGIFTHGTGVSGWGVRTSDGSVITATSGVLPSSGKHLLCVRLNAGAIRLYLDGTDVTSGSPTVTGFAQNAIVLNKRSLGFHGGGKHFEHVRYPASLSDVDRATVATAMKAAWSIP